MDERSPSYEELAALVRAQAEEIRRLQVRVAELERQLGMNSKNSSKPPSSDGLEAKPVSKRSKSSRRPGKQPGRPGQSLRQVENPEHTRDHFPPACEACGCGLGGADEVGDPVRRQVFDLPEITPEVTEHRLHRRRCRCGKMTTAEAPAAVAAAPTSYGPNISALAAYLVVYQHIPIARAAGLIADVCGTPVSTGWISTTIGRTSAALAEVDKLIRTLLTLAHILHVDETSLRVAGDRQWLHVAATDQLTAFHLHPARGSKATEDFAILPEFTGTCVHDFWAAYNRYTSCAHAFCGAHIERELLAAEEANPGQAWPTAARQALLDLADAAHTTRDDGASHIPTRTLEPILDRYRQAIRVGLACHPRADGRKQSKTRNLLQRLRDHESQVLRFAHDLTVPFTNNQAERDLRPTKTQIKISGCHRSETGARNWLRIRAHISTLNKNSIHILTALRDALTGQPWKPQTAAPT